MALYHCLWCSSIHLSNLNCKIILILASYGIGFWSKLTELHIINKKKKVYKRDTKILLTTKVTISSSSQTIMPIISLWLTNLFHRQPIYSYPSKQIYKTDPIFSPHKKNHIITIFSYLIKAKISLLIIIINNNNKAKVNSYGSYLDKHLAIGENPWWGPWVHRDHTRDWARQWRRWDSRCVKEANLAKQLTIMSWWAHLNM